MRSKVYKLLLFTSQFILLTYLQLILAPAYAAIYPPELEETLPKPQAYQCMHLKSCDGTYFEIHSQLNYFDRLEASPDKIDAAQIIQEQLQEVHEKKGHAFTAPLGTMLTLYNQMQQLGQAIDELSAGREQQSKAAAENTEEQEATSAATNTRAKNTRAKNPKANQAKSVTKSGAGFNPINILVESTPLLNIAGTIFKAVADSLSASESKTKAENPQEGLQTEAGANTHATETRSPRGGTQAGTFEGASTGTATDSGAGSGAGSGFASQPPVSGNTSPAGGGLGGTSGGAGDPTPAAESVSQAFTPATQPSTLSSAELGSNGRGVFTGIVPENNEQNDRQTRTTPIPARKPDLSSRGVSNWDPDTSGWDSQQFVPQVNLSEEFSIPRTQSAQHALQPQPNFETRGRTTVRGQPAPQRNGSPPRLPDTGFEQLMQGTTNEIGNWSVAKDRLLAGEINAKNIARTAGYCALEHIASESQKLDTLTFGLWSKFGEGVEYVSDIGRTYIRRGTRWATGDQRLGQNAGDYVYAALSVVGPKKFLAPVEIAKKSQTLIKVARVGQKLNPVSKAPKATKVPKNLPSQKATAWRMKTSGKVKLEALDLNGLWSKSMRGGSAGSKAKDSTKVHRNSLQYQGETHVYSIRNVSRRYNAKIGESTQGYRKRDGASKRAEQQARKFRRETGDVYVTRIRQKYLNKKDAKVGETKRIETVRKLYGNKALPGNKNNH
ncbi:MAG: hypothetical protein ABFQ95_06320 [Pseudomonadota bacterium]